MAEEASQCNECGSAPSPSTRLEEEAAMKEGAEITALNAGLPREDGSGVNRKEGEAAQSEGNWVEEARPPSGRGLENEGKKKLQDSAHHELPQSQPHPHSLGKAGGSEGDWVKDAEPLSGRGLKDEGIRVVRSSSSPVRSQHAQAKEAITSSPSPSKPVTLSTLGISHQGLPRAPLPVHVSLGERASRALSATGATLLAMGMATPPPAGAAAARSGSRAKTEVKVTKKVIGEETRARILQALQGESVEVKKEGIKIWSDGSCSKYELPPVEEVQQILTTNTFRTFQGQIHPEDFLWMVLEKNGYLVNKVSALTSYCHAAPTNEQIEAYSNELVNAVRESNIALLQSLAESGKSMQACNKYGAGILHLACRRGNTKVVKFLLSCGSSVAVSDDYGRTPLHDACWAAKPCFDVVKLILNFDVRLLRVQDCRGSTPLQYVRQQDWGSWCAFIDSIKHIHWWDLKGGEDSLGFIPDVDPEPRDQEAAAATAAMRGAV
ncbi:unnamed protein product [Chrysoparadoxa australica]